MLPRLTGIHAALPIPVHIIATVSPAWTMDSPASPAPSLFFVANLRHRAGETWLEPEAESERRPRGKRYGKETLRRAKTGRAEHCCVSSVQHHIGSPQKVSRQLVNGIIRHLGLPAPD